MSSSSPQLLEFDQSEFFGGLPVLASMDTTGYVYVPTPCQNGSGTATHTHPPGVAVECCT